MWKLFNLIVIFVVPVILIGIGVFFRKHSLKMQKFISFPLITSCLTVLFLECSIITLIAIDDLFKIKGEIVLIFFELLLLLIVLILGICGLISSILICNKILTLEFKLVFLNIIGMFITILIGAVITIGPLFAAECGFFNGHIQKLATPFSSIFLICLGSFLGAILWSKLLKNKQ